MFSHPPCLPQTLHRETSLSIAAPRQPNLSARCAPSPTLVGPSPLTHPGEPLTPQPSQGSCGSAARVPWLAGLAAGAAAGGRWAGPSPRCGGGGWSRHSGHLSQRCRAPTSAGVAVGTMGCGGAADAGTPRGCRESRRPAPALLAAHPPEPSALQRELGSAPLPSSAPPSAPGRRHRTARCCPGPAHLSEGPCQRAGCRRAQPRERASHSRSDQQDKGSPASLHLCCSNPSLWHSIQSLTTVVQETPAQEENWERDSAGRTPTVPRAGILGSKSKQNSWEILRSARSSPRASSGRSQGSAGRPQPGRDAGERPAPRPGRERPFALSFRPHWCFPLVQVCGVDGLKPRTPLPQGALAPPPPASTDSPRRAGTPRARRRSGPPAAGRGWWEGRRGFLGQTRFPTPCCQALSPHRPSTRGKGME